MICVRPHRRKEQPNRVSHVHVLDRLEQRFLDRAWDFAAENEVICRGEVRGAAGVRGLEGFSHLQVEISSARCENRADEATHD